MERHRTLRALVTVVALWMIISPVGDGAAAQQERALSQDQAVAGAPDEIDRRYEAYGFVFEQYDHHESYGRFTGQQIAVLGVVIAAYADLVGGPEELAALVDGPVHVRQDRQAVVSYTQAGQVIGLGRGAFDLAQTIESNFYTWGAGSGDELAQIVFGHEIGHRWIEGLRRRDGRDWTDLYGQNVWRGERPTARPGWDDPADPADPEEEAVTNLALFVLGRGYRWTFLRDAPAGAGRQLRIDGWVHDLTAQPMSQI